MRVLAVTKKNALARGHLGCLGDIATLNVARGCAGQCTFCFARCLPGIPDPDTLLLYDQLPALLRHELDSPRRRTALPSFVFFSTASDAFLGGPDVVRVTHTCLEIILRRHIGVTVSTRGEIPPETLALLAEHSRRVRVLVPMVSLADDYTSVWEPGSARPERRLFLIQRLHELKIPVAVRLSPIIPYVNDQTPSLRQLFTALRGLDIGEVTLSLLHFRPGVREQLRHEAPAETLRLLFGSFGAEDAISDAEAPKFAHVSPNIALAIFRRIQRIGRENGIKIVACRCENPGLSSRPCVLAPELLEPPAASQATMFDEGAS